MSDLTRDMRACVKPWEGTGHIAEKYMLRGAARIDELEAALDRIRRIHPEGLTKSAADAFFECQQIADAAMTPKQT